MPRMYHTTGFTKAEINEHAQELKPASFRRYGCGMLAGSG